MAIQLLAAQKKLATCHSRLGVDPCTIGMSTSISAGNLCFSHQKKGLEPKWHIPHMGVLGFMSFLNSSEHHLRGAWRDRDTNDIFAHCSLIFYFLDFKFSNFVCPSVLHRLIWFFLKNSLRKKKNIRKTTQNALAPSIFIVLSIALRLGTPLLHTQAQNTLLQIF